MLDDELLQEEYDKGYSDAETEIRQKLAVGLAQALRNWEITYETHWETTLTKYKLEVTPDDLNPFFGLLEQAMEIQRHPIRAF